MTETTITDAATHPSRLARDFFGLARHHHQDMLAEHDVQAGAEHLVAADLDVAAVTGAIVDGDEPRPLWRQTMNSGDEVAIAILACANMLVTKVAELAFNDDEETFSRIQRARQGHGRWSCIANLTAPHVSVGLVGEKGFDEIARFRNPGALQ